jgi:uncharacterized protein (DUF4415 family)
MATRAFADPFALIEQDRIEQGEHRWQTLGLLVEGYLLVLVAHTVLDDEDGNEVIRIISASRAEPKERNTMSKIVRYEMDLSNPPPLTDKQEAELKALAAMPDKTIDTSDIPPLDDAFWKNAVSSPFYRPTKTSITVRVDSDVLAWLRGQGQGYQTRINAILRDAMLRALHHKA